MTIGIEMADLEARLDSLDLKIDNLTKAVQSIAIQGEKINMLERRVDALWVKYDGLIQEGGTIDRVKSHQATCPRGQVRVMWIVVIPMGFTLLAMGYALLR